MKYLIVCEIRRKEIIKFHKNLIRNVHSKFGVDFSYKYDYPFPSHFTLKYYFGKKSLKYVEKILNNFSKTIYKSNLIIGGIGTDFKRDALFLKVKPLKNSKKLYKKLLTELRQIKNLTWEKRDVNLINRFHLTIARKDLGGKYTDIRKFLDSFNLIKFPAKFDNIAIYEIQKSKNKWVLYRRFELK